MLRSRRFTASALVVTALVTMPLLSGCFKNPVESLVEGVVKGAVEEATGGSVSLGGELPKGWPDEVPVIDGEILGGGGVNEGAEQGWMVYIKPSSSDPLGEARAQLEGAGFTENADLSQAAGAGAVLMSNGSYGVVVITNEQGVAYTVFVESE